ncbi:unnamed protein product [Symbiodinium sp. CCMP2592]|nr:unnamed protein product [Symbiodinium sp. CCMP2592]
MALEDIVYVICDSQKGPVSLCGWIVGLPGADAVIGTSVKATIGLPQTAKGKQGEHEVSFVRVPLAAVTEQAPVGWTGLRPKDLPPLRPCQAAWKAVEKGGAELESILAPGQTAKSRSSRESREEGGDLDMRKMIRKGLAEGQSPNELMPLMLMTLALEKGEGRRKKKGKEAGRDLNLLGFSDSDDSDEEAGHLGKGMQAVATLHRLHECIRKRPRRIIQQFEAEVVRELGVTAGQPWTLNDWVKRQSWGKFKGLQRAAVQDVEVYELLRNGESAAAAAQVIQNLKSKVQCVLQGGDWQTAWLLAGLEDPLTKKEFAGSKQEMAIISSYVKALADLKKKVREGHSAGSAADEDGDGMAAAPRNFLLERSGDNVPLFPCALPFPEVVVAASFPSDESGILSWWSRAFVNTFVAWGNFVTLGCPAEGASAYEPRVSYRCAAEARAFALELLGEVEEFATLDLVLGRLGCSGKRGCIDELLRQVRCTGGACYAGTAQGKVSTALPVVASRVALPPKAGLVDPCKWLPPERAAILQDLAGLKKAEEAWGDVPVACHRVEPSEEDELVRRLVRHGMALPFLEDALPRDREGRLLVGGLFGVAKNEAEDRLIFDRRPENATMEKLPWAKLPSGACFTRLLLKPTEYLRGSGDDLRNYYYTLRLPDNWIKHNAVGRRLSAQVRRELGLLPHREYRLCFRVLAMGDVNGCDIAQAVHESVLQRWGLLGADCTLVYGEPVPRGPSWQGVYIDDLLICQRCSFGRPVPLDGSFLPPPPLPQDEDVQKVAAAEQAYEEAGLQRAIHKEFWYQCAFKAWGAEVDGVAGKVGAPKDVRRQVWMLLFKIVSGGWASGDVLRQVLGYLAYIFQYRRELYALHHRMYKFVDGMPPDRWVKLPNYVLDELRSCALHLPFAVSSMRRRVSSTLLATDATPTSGGAVVTEAPEALAEELWRQSEVKGEAVRIDRELESVLSDSVPKVPSVFASTVGECLPWRVVASYSFRETSHVNLQELRAWRREMCRIAASGGHRNCIIVALNDSRVVVGAVAKGRSSSVRLNNLLRGALPHLILGGVSGAVLWIETAANPADHPSRLIPAATCSSRSSRLASLRLRGCEVCSGDAIVTQAHKDLNLEMGPPLDLLQDGAGQTRVAELHIDVGHPGGTIPRVAEATELWQCCLDLAWAVLQAGGYFFLVHPRRSRAWGLAATESLLHVEGVRLLKVDGCAFGQHPDRAVPKLPLRVLTNAPWAQALEKECPGTHVHCEWHPRFQTEVIRELGRAVADALVRDTPPPTIDRVLEKCIDEAYRRGEKLYFVRLGLIGLQRAWHLSGPLLRRSWAAIRGWRVLQPVRSRIPMSRSVLRALLITLLATGNSTEGFARECYWGAMLASWLSFEALLRPGETAALRILDLTFPDGCAEELEAGGLVITIRKPDSATDLSLIRWLRWWTAGPDGILFRVARRQWSRLFAEGLGRLHLGNRGFTLSSLRFGGATWHFRVYENLPKLQYMGRWSRPDTLKYYLHEAMTIKVDAEAKPESKDAVHLALQHADKLELPPRMSSRLSRALRELAAALEEAFSSTTSTSTVQQRATGPTARAQGGPGSSTCPAGPLGAHSSCTGCSDRLGGSIPPRLAHLPRPGESKAATPRGTSARPGADTWRRLEKSLPKRAVIRLSRTAPARGELSSRPAPLARSTPRTGDASTGDLKGATEALMSAVGSAADRLGAVEVDGGRTAEEILGDEASRASAARWRSGSLQRKLTAALARLVTSVQQWTPLATPPGPSSRPLAPVQPLPLRTTTATGSAPTGSLPFGWRWSGLRFAGHGPGVGKHWRCLGCLFPRVVALLLALLFRLFIRGCLALASHVLRELCTQTLALAGELESFIVEWLTLLLGMQTTTPAQLTRPFQAPPNDHGSYSYQGDGNNFAGATTQVALPARPLDFVTWVLLAYNIYQQRQQGGVGIQRGV